MSQKVSVAWVQGRLSGVAQCIKGILEANRLHLQTGMRAKAGCAAVVANQKTCSSFGQADQPQGVSHERGVEDDVISAVYRDCMQPESRTLICMTRPL